MVALAKLYEERLIPLELLYYKSTWLPPITKHVFLTSFFFLKNFRKCVPISLQINPVI